MGSNGTICHKKGSFLVTMFFSVLLDDGVDDSYILGDNRLSSDDDGNREMETIWKL